jgi:hypothetical protein
MDVHTLCPVHKIGTDNIQDFLDWAQFPVLTDGVNDEVWHDMGVGQ